ncbi:hypothetical protein Nizo2264_2541 [Lactiplantibacillus plantarum]|nr:hypothetical protein Nizo2264_2541 [Lactiplantibacillus plantarum]
MAHCFNQFSKHVQAQLTAAHRIIGPNKTKTNQHLFHG